MDSLDKAIHRLRRVVVDSVGVVGDLPEPTAAPPREFYQAARQLPRAGGLEGKGKATRPGETLYAEAPNEAGADRTSQPGIPGQVKRRSRVSMLGEVEGSSSPTSSARAERDDIPAGGENFVPQPPPTPAQDGEVAGEKRSGAPSPQSKNLIALWPYILLVIALLILLSLLWMG